MNSDLRSMFMGGGIVLVVVAAGAGIWSMGVSPTPPAMTQARAEETLAKAQVNKHMGEFISHYRRANAAMTRGDHERAQAHLTVMDEFGEELESGRLRHKIPASDLSALRGALKAARTGVAQGTPDAAQMVINLKERCVKCHLTQSGPSEEELFGLTASSFLQ